MGWLQPVQHRLKSELRVSANQPCRSALSFSPDNRLLAALQWDGNVQLWHCALCVANSAKWVWTGKPNRRACCRNEMKLDPANGFQSNWHENYNSTNDLVTPHLCNGFAPRATLFFGCSRCAVSPSPAIHERSRTLVAECNGKDERFGRPALVRTAKQHRLAQLDATGRAHALGQFHTWRTAARGASIKPIERVLPASRRRAAQHCEAGDERC